MSNYFKKNIVIMIAIALPFIFILFFALATYLPNLFLTTKYNFIYANCENGTNYYSYDCKAYLQRYLKVVDGKLVLNEISPNADFDGNGRPDFTGTYLVHIFLHDTQKNESKEISIQEAQNFSLNDIYTAPDGITFVNQYDRGAEVFPFIDTNSSYNFYLQKGSNKKQMHILGSNNSYSENNVKFLGWIINKNN